jgi:geranylgeranyl diphosphate synthase, type II
MRHSVFAGGKRLRPILCREAGRMIDGKLPDGIDELGAALEMLHTYSLIHDDLPALDNDDLRRGRPTCHVAFGEATAILAGDALQTQAYEVLARLQCPAEARVRIIEEIAHGTGTIDGMIGGQVVDLEAEHSKPDLATLEYIHRAKTAALITASLVSGGVYAGGEAEEIKCLRSFGQQVGLAFQIVDDVLNLRGFAGGLKSRGEDVTEGKVTAPVAKALALLGRPERRALWDVIASKPSDPEVIAGVIATIEGCGALDACERQARELIEGAWRRVDAVFPDSHAKVNLRAFSWFILERHY